MNVQQAITNFLQHGESVRNLSTRTLRAYESDLSQFNKHMVGTETVAITSDDLEGYLEKLNLEPYRDTSIRRKVAALKVFFRYLEDKGVVEESPAKRLKIKKPVENKIPVVLSARELKALLSAPKRHLEGLIEQREGSTGGRNRYFCAVRDNVIIELLSLTGIRIGELVALNVMDVDLAERQIRIMGRGTRGRIVPLTSDLVGEALGQYIIARNERSIENEALFVGRSGTRLTIYSIENIFKKHVRMAEIKRHVTPHSLRHTMAAMQISSGTDIRAVQELLGHASILSTQVYTKLPPLRRMRSAPVEMVNKEGVTLDAPSSRLLIKKS